MKRLSRVICAVAIDDRDRHVFAHALALARRNDANLLVLHAASPEIAFNQGATERVDFCDSFTRSPMPRALTYGSPCNVDRSPRSFCCTHARDMRL